MIHNVLIVHWKEREIPAKTRVVKGTVPPIIGLIEIGMVISKTGGWSKRRQPIEGQELFLNNIIHVT